MRRKDFPTLEESNLYVSTSGITIFSIAWRSFLCSITKLNCWAVTFRDNSPFSFANLNLDISKAGVVLIFQRITAMCFGIFSFVSARCF